MPNTLSFRRVRRSQTFTNSRKLAVSQFSRDRVQLFPWRLWYESLSSCKINCRVLGMSIYHTNYLQFRWISIPPTNNNRSIGKPSLKTTNSNFTKRKQLSKYCKNRVQAAVLTFGTNDNTVLQNSVNSIRILALGKCFKHLLVKLVAGKFQGCK